LKELHHDKKHSRVCTSLRKEGNEVCPAMKSSSKGGNPTGVHDGFPRQPLQQHHMTACLILKKNVTLPWLY